MNIFFTHTLFYCFYNYTFFRFDVKILFLTGEASMKALPPEIQHAVKYGVRPTNIHHDPMSLYIEQFSSKWILPTPINATAIAMHTTGLFKGKAKKNRFPVPLSSSYYMVSKSKA